MKPILALALVTTFALVPLRAQESEAPAAPSAPASEESDAPKDDGPLSDANMQDLMSAETFADFTTKLDALVKKGVSPQTRTELILVHCFQSKDWANLATNLPSGDLAAAPYADGGSKFFPTADVYHSFLLICQGSLEINGGKIDAARKTFTDALWLAPEHAPIIGEQIGEYRKTQKMASYKLPLETKLKDSQGKDATLAELVKGKKALLIDFWASWCGPCMKLMPELAEKAKKLEPQEVAVVGMNTEGEPDKAEKVRADEKITFPWLMEPEGQPFSKGLEISSIPRMILVSPDGAVLYNGHPMDPGLKDALKKISIEL